MTRQYSAQADTRFNVERRQAVVQGQFRFDERLKSLYLPDGYPKSVTPDYLPYQLWALPTHITGWLAAGLTTSSLLKAVGISASPVGATAAAAAIKWIIKDGIGAAGRFLVGGRLGLELDDDPRRWRMIAELLTTLGLAMEIATSKYPSSFLVLASLGNFTKAVGKGIGKPVFRVVQTHFAAIGNVGAVAAKEEVWEVTGQLLGYAASVATLQYLEEADSWRTVAGLWAAIQGVHVLLRYISLKQLRFTTLSHKRALALVKAHVAGQDLPSVEVANKEEDMLVAAALLSPQVVPGCSLEEAFGGPPTAELLSSYLDLYQREGYLLVRRGGVAYVVLKDEVSAEVLLRAFWQAAWLDQHDKEQKLMVEPDGRISRFEYEGNEVIDRLPSELDAQLVSTSGNPRGPQGPVGAYSSEGNGVLGLGVAVSLEGTPGHDITQSLSGLGEAAGNPTDCLAALSSSLLSLQRLYPSFISSAVSAGWRVDQVVMKLGTARVRVSE